jgi:hypothetical protein
MDYPEMRLPARRRWCSPMTKSKTALTALLVSMALAMGAPAEEPEQVRPSTGTLAGLRKVSSEVSKDFGARLDKGHDWLYRRMQSLLTGLDTRYSGTGQEALLVPLSPLRIGLNSELLHGSRGLTTSFRPDFEATLRLPNIERRFKLFISSSDLPESSGDPALEPYRFRFRCAREVEACGLRRLALDTGIQCRGDAPVPVREALRGERAWAGRQRRRCHRSLARPLDCALGQLRQLGAQYYCD